jgi:hypothetical protein
MRALFTLYLALVWLIVPYPYGLWLFALSAIGFGRWQQGQVWRDSSEALKFQKTRLG